MATTTSPMKTSRASAKSARGTAFTAEERAAMRERAKELKAAASDAEAKQAVLARIAQMPEPDRGLARKVHAIVTGTAPALAPRLWYGMPAYAKDANVVCFFQDALKFKSRYATLGFSDKASLDDGGVWPVAYALKGVTAADEARIRALVKKAVG